MTRKLGCRWAVRNERQIPKTRDTLPACLIHSFSPRVVTQSSSGPATLTGAENRAVTVTHRAHTLEREKEKVANTISNGAQSLCRKDIECGCREKGEEGCFRQGSGKSLSEEGLFEQGLAQMRNEEKQLAMKQASEEHSRWQE